jgi:hypothetical protein
MAFYNIDTEKFINDNVPTFKRLQWPALSRLAKGLLTAFTRLVGIFIKYKEGGAVIYTAGTYNKGDLVTYNYQVFECYVDGTTSTPDDRGRWRSLFTNWRGTNEAQLYNGNSMQLEYALNRFYGLTFSNTPNTSSIRVATNTIPEPNFLVSTLASQSSQAGLTTSDNWVGLTYSSTAAPTSITIRVPIVWYFSLSTNPDEKIRSFADNYVAEGLTYTIQIYF